MKCFAEFRLDTQNHLLWRGDERVPITPKAFDVLAYLVDHEGRVVTVDDVLEACWPSTYVNPEILRKYILEIRKALGDQINDPKFIQTLTKRGYRFIATVVDDQTQGQDQNSSHGQVGSTSTVGYQVRVDRPWWVQRRLLGVMAFFVIVIAGTVALRYTSARSQNHTSSLNDYSIAVMPFTDVGSDPTQEYFSDGLAEQLIDDLAKIPGLKVIGRASSFKFKGKDEDPRIVGQKLNVSDIVEASVRHEGNHVRITIELIKADSGVQLWSRTYDRAIGDIFSVEDEIALAVTTALRVKMSGSNARSSDANSDTNPDAYQAYLQSQYFLTRGRNRSDLDRALSYANSAISLDERYGPAWALRASVQIAMGTSGWVDASEALRKARDDAKRAIVLEPDFAGGYIALAKTQIFFDRDWDAASISIAKASALEPGSYSVLRYRAFLAITSGDIDQAIALDKQAINVEPLRPISYLNLGTLLFEEGRYPDARAALEKALDLNPQATFVHVTIGKILIAEGEPREALEKIQEESSQWDKLTGLALAYHALGRQHDSEAALDELIQKYASSAGYQIAQIYASYGEHDKTFFWLQRAYEAHDEGIFQIKEDPLLKDLRQDRRYRQLLKQLHLPV